MALSFQSVGETVGAAVPLPFASTIGKVAGGLLDSLPGFFGSKGGGTGAGAFAGLHSDNYSQIDDGQYNKGDAELMVKWAKANKLTVEEVAIVLAYDSKDSGNAPSYVWDAYAYDGGERGIGMVARTYLGALRAGAMYGSPRALVNYGGTPSIINLSGSGGLSAQVNQAAPQPTSVSINNLDGYLASQVQQPIPVPTSQALTEAQKGLLGDVIKSAKDGAISGATDAILRTPQGQAAEDKGAMDWLNRNALKIAAVLIPVAVGITILINKAFSRR